MNLESRKGRFMTAALAVLLLTGVAFAAEPVPVAPSVSESAIDMERGAFARFLDSHPEISEEVGEDAGFLKNADFLRDHPELGAFLEAHPLVKADPRAFVSSQRRRGYQPDAIEKISPIIGVGAFLLAGLWVFRSLLEARRWSRAAKTQADIHTKLLDRFGSSQEMLTYMQTEAGKRFLESGSITVEGDPQRRTPQLVSRILWSVQSGLVLLFVGLGLMWLRASVTTGSEPFLVLGALAMSLGAGFLLSAGVSYLLSKRLGLLDTSSSARQA